MTRQSARILAVLAIQLAASPALAVDELAETLVRSERYYVSYVINPDGSHAEMREISLVILDQKILEWAKRTTVSYSTSVERVEVLEAYTRKPDGRHVDVPKSNYQFDINQGRDKGPAAFSDRTRMTVIFPEAAVGDAVVIKYQVTQIEAMFPGHFSVDNRFARASAYDDVRIRLDAPAAFWLQHAVTEMTETANETRDGRKVVEWRWKNPSPLKTKRRNYSAFDPDKEPGYAISSFRNYGQIAEAYGARARPKAIVTERVRVLAGEITKGLETPRERARALYEWAATNINYAGNDIGVGAVVPRDQEFVLDNKMGDCKDHATLLQALLAAKGIESTQALLNSGSTYALPTIPVLSMVNHVIVFVPSLDVYLDSTSHAAPFDMLPFGDSDKPVLLVDGYKDGTRTPPIRAEASLHRSVTDVTLTPGGTIAGTIQVYSKGRFAVTGRERLRFATAQAREDMLKKLYRQDHKTGFGRIEGDDPKPMLASYNYKVSFESEEFTPGPGTGAFSIFPLYYVEGSMKSFSNATDEEESPDESACIGGTVVEEYAFHLPDTMKVLALPKGISLDGKLLSYRSTYAMEGNTLIVKREAIDKTNRNVCSKAMNREFNDLAHKISADLKAQVVYQ